jgi:ABC-type antimicrobial peptide transport system permease subunit
MSEKLLPDIPFSVDGIGLASVVCIALGTVFGIIPALQAARLDPIESLRNEK